MDIQRLVLVFSLCFVSFLLWEAWQKDYGTNTSPEQATLAEPGKATQPSEVPDVTFERADKGQRFVEKSTTKDQLISVETDLFNIDVNLHGGDIVKASFKEHSKTLDGNKPYLLLSNDASELNIAQSGLISQKGPDETSGKRAVFRVAQNAYYLKDGDDVLDVTLIWENSDVLIEKHFVFYRGSYSVDVFYQVVNKSSNSWNGKFYAQLKQKARDNESSQFGAYTFVGAAVSTDEKPYEKVSYDELTEAPLNIDVNKGWVAFVSHYFLSAWVPEEGTLSHFYSKRMKDNIYRIGFTGETIEVQPGETKQVGGKLYIGPKVQEQLEKTAANLDLTIDYGWLWFLCVPLFWLLKWFHELVGNWGWAIVLVTICVKGAFFHLSATSYRSMANLRKLQPKMVALKERYGDDRQKMSQAMMELYKKEKINPLGGCLPILVQIPVFIALYWVLLESVELRHAGFILWINDLSAKDPYFVLPVLMGITMFLQQLLSPAPVDPMHAKMMKIFPLVFTFFFMLFPSGLVLYWVVSNILSILQQWLITRVIMKPDKAKA